MASLVGMWLLLTTTITTAYAEEDDAATPQPQPAAAEAEATAEINTPQPAGRRGHLDLYGGTRFPATMGVGLRYEGASRLQISASAGRIPEAYTSPLQSALDAATSYEALGQAADAMLTDAPYLHLGAGWRPFPDGAMVLSVGHQTLWLEGEAAEFTVEGYSIDADAALASRLKMLTGELRFDHNLGERLVLSWAVGGMMTYEADSTLTLPDGVDIDGTEELMAELDALYEDYFRTPAVGLSLGYRFF